MTRHEIGRSSKTPEVCAIGTGLTYVFMRQLEKADEKSDFVVEPILG